MLVSAATGLVHVERHQFEYNQHRASVFCEHGIDSLCVRVAFPATICAANVKLISFAHSCPALCHGMCTSLQYGGQVVPEETSPHYTLVTEGVAYSGSGESSDISLAHSFHHSADSLKLLVNCSFFLGCVARSIACRLQASVRDHQLPVCKHIRLQGTQQLAVPLHAARPRQDGPKIL